LTPSLSPSVPVARERVYQSNSMVAPPLPGSSRSSDTDVCFRYPDQPSDQGLRHISFYLPPGSTTGPVVDLCSVLSLSSQQSLVPQGVARHRSLGCCFASMIHSAAQSALETLICVSSLSTVSADALESSLRTRLSSTSLSFTIFAMLGTRRHSLRSKRSQSWRKLNHLLMGCLIAGRLKSEREAYD
jgi:hypothetical protein